MSKKAKPHKSRPLKLRALAPPRGEVDCGLIKNGTRLVTAARRAVGLAKGEAGRPPGGLLQTEERSSPSTKRSQHNSTPIENDYFQGVDMHEALTFRHLSSSRFPKDGVAGFGQKQPSPPGTNRKQGKLPPVVYIL